MLACIIIDAELMPIKNSRLGGSSSMAKEAIAAVTVVATSTFNASVQKSTSTVFSNL